MLSGLESEIISELFLTLNLFLGENDLSVELLFRRGRAGGEIQQA